MGTTKIIIYISLDSPSRRQKQNNNY